MDGTQDQTETHDQPKTLRFLLRFPLRFPLRLQQR